MNWQTWWRSICHSGGKSFTGLRQGYGVGRGVGDGMELDGTGDGSGGYFPFWGDCDGCLSPRLSWGCNWVLFLSFLRLVGRKGGHKMYRKSRWQSFEDIFIYICFFSQGELTPFYFVSKHANKTRSCLHFVNCIC